MRARIFSDDVNSLRGAVYTRRKDDVITYRFRGQAYNDGDIRRHVVEVDKIIGHYATYHNCPFSHHAFPKLRDSLHLMYLLNFYKARAYEIEPI